MADAHHVTRIQRQHVVNGLANRTELRILIYTSLQKSNSADSAPFSNFDIGDMFGRNDMAQIHPPWHANSA